MISINGTFDVRFSVHTQLAWLLSYLIYSGDILSQLLSIFILGKCQGKKNPGQNPVFLSPLIQKADLQMSLKSEPARIRWSLNTF